MDDATSAVDPEVEARILAALREDSSDATVVVVAYRKATIGLADEVVFLAGGRIVDQGPHASCCAATRPTPTWSTPTSRQTTSGCRSEQPGEQPRRRDTEVLSGEAATARATLRSGVRLSPELVHGALGHAAVRGASPRPGACSCRSRSSRPSTGGSTRPGGPDVGFVATMAGLTALGVLLTGASSAMMTARLFRAAESGLATLRIKAFRHVHDLPVLTQNTERRGALVSRVTSDVDQVSQFLVFGGVIAIVSVGQIAVATVVMLVYSWQLTLVVWLAFLPLFLSLRYFQRRLSEAYATVRRQVGALLSAVSEPVVGAAVGPQLRGRGAHPGAHRRRRRAPPDGEQPGPGAHRVLLLAGRHLRRVSPTPA